MKSAIIVIIALAAMLILPAIGQNAQYWRDQGNEYFKYGDFKNASESYEKALELEPNSTDLWNNKGRALANSGQIDNAISCFEKSIALNSSDPEPMNLKAIALSQGQQKYLESIILFNRILSMSPEYFEAWNGKGMALASLGDLDSALQCLENATKIEPKNPVGWNNKGVVLREMQKYQDALNSFNQALLLDPSYETARQNREYTLEDMDQTSGVAPVSSSRPGWLTSI
jgi:tetratricopeptide (TPR) repeat protein